MKKGTPLFKNRKLRYGSLSVTLTAAIIAAVVIINVIFTHLASKHLWVIDMTSDGIYSLTEAGITYLDKTIESANDDRSEKGEDPVKVKILFCDEPDALEANELQRIVYVMAKELQNQFPDTIEVDWVDIIKNPSAVQSYGNPKTTSVIVISGTEYRTVPLTSFYVFDTIDSTEPWAYKVERTFAINIAGVTRAESPIACWTTNHGELAYDNEILSLITDAGYILRPIDLAKEDIPADCRLIVTYKPENDFLSSKDGISSISEVEKLDAFTGDDEYPHGVAECIVNTSAGAKWAIFGLALWNGVVDSAVIKHILDVSDRISDNSLAARLLAPALAVLLPRKNDDGKTVCVSVINCTIGKSGELELLIRNPKSESFRFMSQYNGECDLDFEKRGDDYIVKIPSLEPWSVGTVFVK